jgi:hypothetical protein
LIPSNWSTLVNEQTHTPKFWIGNVMLTLALILLIYLGELWAVLGAWAMVLWVALAGGGMYLVMQEKGPPSNMPD